MAAQQRQISVFRCGIHSLFHNSMPVAVSCDPAEPVGRGVGATLKGSAFLREQNDMFFEVVKVVCVDSFGFYAPRFCRF